MVDLEGKMNENTYPDALSSLESWLRDPEVSEIMVNGHNSVYLERKARLVRVPRLSLTTSRL